MKTYPSIEKRFRGFTWHSWQHPLNLSDANIEQFVEGEILRLSPYIPQDTIVIDVGAYTGDTTLPMAILTGTGGLCYAFEPNRAVFPTLFKNAVSNQIECAIYPINAAVGFGDQAVVFHYSDDDYCNGGKLLSPRERKVVHPSSQTVRSVRMQDFIPETYWPSISFIKLDTEGNDLTVLKSIEDIINASFPTIQVEIFPDLSLEERIELHEHLTWLGYKPISTPIEEITSTLSVMDVLYHHS